MIAALYDELMKTTESFRRAAKSNPLITCCYPGCERVAPGGDAVCCYHGDDE